MPSPTREKITSTAKVQVPLRELKSVGTKDAGMRIRFRMLKFKAKFRLP